MTRDGAKVTLMELKKVNPESLKFPTNAYSQGIVIPLGSVDLMFVTGQVAQDKDGNVIEPNNAKVQTEVVFSRIEAILAENGMSLDNVVKAQIFLTNMDDKHTVTEIRNELFKEARPVSTLVGVTGLAKEGCCVEIEVTAVKEQN